MKRIRNKYRLELHWESIDYKNDQIAVLNGAYFSGPVLKRAAKLEAPDFIDLDVTPQVGPVLSSYYIIRLEWETAYHKEDKVILEGVKIINRGLRDLHKISSEDYILIDTEKHEEETHPYHLVYESLLVKRDGSPYDYKDK